MDAQEFTKKYNDVRDSVINAVDKALEMAIGNEVIDFDKCVGNYLDVYPLIAAVLQRELNMIIKGSPYESTRRSQSIKAAGYRRDYRIWWDYAGDYRYKGKNN